jgi:ankyrin repeat protein
MKASHMGDAGIVRQLIAAGARLDLRNTDGGNALWLACVGNHLDIIDMLIDAGTLALLLRQVEKAQKSQAAFP